MSDISMDITQKNIEFYDDWWNYKMFMENLSSTDFFAKGILESFVNCAMSLINVYVWMDEFRKIQKDSEVSWRVDLQIYRMFWRVAKTMKSIRWYEWSPVSISREIFMNYTGVRILFRVYIQDCKINERLYKNLYIHRRRWRNFLKSCKNIKRWGNRKHIKNSMIYVCIHTRSFSDVWSQTWTSKN